MKTTFAQDLLEMMEAWNKIMASARDQFPEASDEELYQLAKVRVERRVGRFL